MATAVAKALNSKSGQAAIRSKAAAAVRRNSEKLKQEFAAKMKRAKAKAKADSRDLLMMAVDPVLTGAGGALALDLAMKPVESRVPMLSGAVGDVVKAAGGIAAGYYGPRYIKSPYFAHAMIGVAIVNAHRLGTRVMNRAASGQLAGLFSGDGTDDLAGLDAMPDTIPVPVRLTDGRVITARMDADGRFFDLKGRHLPFAGNGSAPGRQALAGVESEDDAFERPELNGTDDLEGMTDPAEFTDYTPEPVV